MSSTEKDAQIAEMQETIRTLRWTLGQQQQQVTAPLVKAAQESAQAQADEIQEYTTSTKAGHRLWKRSWRFPNKRFDNWMRRKKLSVSTSNLVLEELKNPIKIEQEEEVKELILEPVREKSSISSISRLILPVA